MSPARKREAARQLREKFRVSERRVCQVVNQRRSTQRYRSKRPGDEEQRLVKHMHELVRQHPRYGYRFIWACLRQEGWRVSRKRIYRLWRQEQLKVPKKPQKRRSLGSSEKGIVRQKAEHKDDVWCWDFIHDSDERGRPLKWLSIVDEFTRDCLVLEVERSITARDVIDLMAELFIIRGVPRHIRSDNGPEFIANAMRAFLDCADVKTLYIEKGAP